MRILVTGSSGLLGGCLVSRLAEREAELRLLDLAPAPEGHAAQQSAHEFVRDDLSDEARVVEAVRGCDVVYHLAAAQRMKPQFSTWSEADIYARNFEAVRLVLSAAERNGVRKVVFTSSSGVYGFPRSELCREDHPKQPLGAYGRSKLEAERLCREAADRGLDVTILRPMSLFGPGMSGIFVMLFEWVRRGRPVFMMGSGGNRVQAASAWDVADACMLAAERSGTAGRCYNVASDPAGVPTVLEEVKALVEHAGTESPIVRIPAAVLRAAARTLRVMQLSPIAPEHYILADRDFVLDIRSAREELGWMPRLDNAQMLIDAYDAYVRGGGAQAPQHPVLKVLDRIVALRWGGT